MAAQPAVIPVADVEEAHRFQEAAVAVHLLEDYRMEMSKAHAGIQEFSRLLTEAAHRVEEALVHFAAADYPIPECPSVEVPHSEVLHVEDPPLEAVRVAVELHVAVHLVVEVEEGVVGVKQCDHVFLDHPVCDPCVLRPRSVPRLPFVQCHYRVLCLNPVLATNHPHRCILHRVWEALEVDAAAGTRLHDHR